jgi:hypothetical protein
LHGRLETEFRRLSPKFAHCDFIHGLLETYRKAGWGSEHLVD